MIDLTDLRHTLHRHPELAGDEAWTSATIREQLEALKPDNLVTELGGHGLAATWKGGEEGPHILFRADLDGLPIEDTGDTDHRSEQEGKGHLCGHDGHMTIMVGLARKIAENPPKRGAATVLFQPAEEVGAGAAKVIEDPKFDAIRPDKVFALHNLPGFKKGAVVLRVGPFACASRGLIVRLHGRTAHAAHPELAVSPALAVADLIHALSALPDETEGLKHFSLATVIHAQLGEVAFGTTPGEAVVMATLRSALDEDMERMIDEAHSRINRIAGKYTLRHEIEWTEEFPATINHPETTSALRAAVDTAGLELIDIDEPFRWSEDVGNFSRVAQLTLFGLGSGEKQPPLHAPDYDFPDEIIEPGIRAFEAVLRSYLG